MKSFGWLIRGLIGGAVGGAAWVLVAYYGGYELAIIAWGIGFLVGAGVCYGDGEATSTRGAVVAAIAAVTIIASKYILLSVVTGGITPADLHRVAANIRSDEQAMIAGMAYEIVEERMARGETIPWPPGVTYDNAQRKDIPPDIWSQAEERWRNLGEQGQVDRAAAIAAEIEEVATQMPEISDLFSGWDFLWFFLAMITAFKMGAGLYGSR